MASGNLRWILSITAVLVCSTLTFADPPTFEDKMQELGLSDPGFAWYGYHDAIVCADFDGDVDILVVTSLHEESPKGKQGRIFVNKLAETGRLAFVDETERLFPGGISKSIIADSAPFFWDIDNDGDLDLCSISDEHPGTTFINDHGVFHLEKYGFSAQHCELRDLNNDGLLDVIGTDTGNLYLATGNGQFKPGKIEGELSGHMPRNKVLPTPPGITVDDQTMARAATTQPAPAHVYFAWHKMDINCDGKLDILTVQPRIGTGGAVLAGLGAGKFQKALAVGASSGQAVADLDNDGLLDLVASSPQKTKGLHIWLNKTPSPGHWLKVQLTGPKQNTFATGALIEAYLPGSDPNSAKPSTPLARAQMDSDALPVHLGLGPAGKVDLRISRPGKVIRQQPNVPTNQLLKLKLE